jgi:CBS domain-containing protein
MRVKDVMTVDVASVGPETSLNDMACELSRRGISGMPVVDDAGQILGVITEADVLAMEGSAQHAGAVARLLNRDEREGPSRLSARAVREAMTSPAITIECHWPVAVAAERMIQHGINRLPVVERGRLVGIVARADLVRVFPRSDNRIADDIRELVAIQQQRWHDEQPIQIGIDEGKVTLAGELRRRDEADVVSKMVRTVPGVVSVHSQLTWSEEQ